MPRTGKKRRRPYCLPSCFSSPSVWGAEELEFLPDSSPVILLTRLHSLSRTVPVLEIAGNGGDGRVVEVSGVMQTQGIACRESTQGFNAESSKEPDKRGGQKLQRNNFSCCDFFTPSASHFAGSSPQALSKGGKRSKTIAQPLDQTPLSARTHTKAEHNQPRTCHMSTIYNSRSPPATPLHRLSSPLRTGFCTTHPGTPEPNRTSDQGPPPTRSTRRLDSVAGLLMLAVTLAVMCFFGRLCAVLCSCAWFYLFSCLRSQPSPPPLAPPSPVNEMVRAEELDVISAEYKKKVVLMGLLERNRYGVSEIPVSPKASPVPAKLR